MPCCLTVGAGRLGAKWVGVDTSGSVAFNGEYLP